MQKEQLLVLAGALIRGFLFFAVVMGVAMTCVTANASWSPGVVWFPVPALAVLAGAIWWAQRRWDIGLTSPVGVPRGRIYVIGVAVTLIGISVCVVQGAFTGMVRQTELLEADVSPLFTLTYAILMSVFAAILAEATFRGIIQSRMQTVYGVWPTVIIIGVVNVVAHRWGPEITNNWLGLFATLAGWTYLRWLSQSLWPPLILHTLINLVVASGLWIWGPLDHALLGSGTVIAFAVLGLAALGAAAMLSQKMGPDPI
jgi:membrane protease YdiL (CAAX protease family)